MAKWAYHDVTVTYDSGEQSSRFAQTTAAVPGLALTEEWDRGVPTGRWVITHIGSGELLVESMPLRQARVKLLALAGFADWTLPREELMPVLVAKGWCKTQTEEDR